jgi:hypothetical protein
VRREAEITGERGVFSWPSGGGIEVGVMDCGVTTLGWGWPEDSSANNSLLGSGSKMSVVGGTIEVAEGVSVLSSVGSVVSVPSVPVVIPSGPSGHSRSPEGPATVAVPGREASLPATATALSASSSSASIGDSKDEAPALGGGRSD